MSRTCCIALLLASALAAQQPRIRNANLQTRTAAAGLEQEFRALVNAQDSPAWIGYSVPIVAGRHQMCCYSSDQCCAGCSLESRRVEPRPTAEPIQLEASQYALILYRVELKTVGKIRTFTAECEIDAGGLPVYWLTEVRPAQSIAVLLTFIPHNRDQAVSAIAMHGDPEADRTLEKLASSDQTDAVREKALFWLGSTRGRRGYEVVRRVATEDPSDRIREKAIFALSVSKEPEAVDAMITLARNDKSGRVRGQALFWLGHKAGEKAVSAINDAIENDPETDVKKRAVFALSRLPKDEGVRLLIQVARTNRNPAVRKQAIFWLGQSRDPRALEFFEQILAR